MTQPTSPEQRFEILEQAHAALDKVLADLLPIAEFDHLGDIQHIAGQLYQLLGREEAGSGFDAVIEHEREALRTGHAARMFEASREYAERRRRREEIKRTTRMFVPVG